VEKRVLLCMRVKDAKLVAPGSVQRKCSVCGVDVWVAPRDGIEEMDIRCVSCVPDGSIATMPAGMFQEALQLLRKRDIESN